MEENEISSVSARRMVMKSSHHLAQPGHEIKDMEPQEISDHMVAICTCGRRETFSAKDLEELS